MSLCTPACRHRSQWRRFSCTHFHRPWLVVRSVLQNCLFPFVVSIISSSALSGLRRQSNEFFSSSTDACLDEFAVVEDERRLNVLLRSAVFAAAYNDNGLPVVTLV